MQTCCGVNPFFQLLQNLFLGLSHVSPHLKQMDVRSRDTGPLYLFIFKLVMALETLSLGHLTFAASQLGNHWSDPVSSFPRGGDSASPRVTLLAHNTVTFKVPWSPGVMTLTCLQLLCLCDLCRLLWSFPGLQYSVGARGAVVAHSVCTWGQDRQLEILVTVTEIGDRKLPRDGKDDPQVPSEVPGRTQRLSNTGRSWEIETVLSHAESLFEASLQMQSCLIAWSLLLQHPVWLADDFWCMV